MRVALCLAVMCTILAFAPDRITVWLAFDREAIITGEIWRLWTGHLIHFSTEHAVMDIIVLFVVAALAEREMGLRATTAIVLGAPLLISLGLLVMTPELIIYKGSSAISVLLGTVAGLLIWRRSPKLRISLELLGLVLIIKTVLDTTGIVSEFSSLPVGVQVAWQAHILGGILALACIAVKNMPLLRLNSSGITPK